jgi:hypothetical protein
LVKSEKGRIGIINLFASFVCTAAMEELARAIPPDRIGKEAYHLYEKFRPQVPEGPQGWGAKGILDLDLIRKLAQEYAKN